MDEDFTIFNADDLSLELMKRYKWNAKTRMGEIESIWNSISGGGGGGEIDMSTAFDTAESSQDVSRQSSVSLSQLTQLSATNIKVSDANSVRS